MTERQKRVLEVLQSVRLAIQDGDPHVDMQPVLAWVEEPGADMELRMASVRHVTLFRTGMMGPGTYLDACQKTEAFLIAADEPKPIPPKETKDSSRTSKKAPRRKFGATRSRS